MPDNVEGTAGQHRSAQGRDGRNAGIAESEYRCAGRAEADAAIMQHENIILAILIIGNNTTFLLQGRGG